jgi:hypothetical protein
MPWAFQTLLPMELQIRVLAYLRAVDLSAVSQINRYFYSNKLLQHAIVVYCSESVYPASLTAGFADQPTVTASPSSSSVPKSAITPKKGKPVSSRTPSASTSGSKEDTAGDVSALSPHPHLYTFEHLRNMELLVVARVLNSPEPVTGYVVSKSWCKTALRWLEDQQERRYHNMDHLKTKSSSSSSGKKKTKKQLRKQQCEKQGSKVPPPPANVNSDITCEHDQLQHYTSIRSARARRRLLDKQAWKILKALYPESTCLPSSSATCLQCQAEACQAQKAAADELEAAKQRRKLPLQNPVLRRVYTRTRGVPEQCLRDRRNVVVGSVTAAEENNDEMLDCKMSASSSVHSKESLEAGEDDHPGMYPTNCPLMDGTYYILPRSWCHGWRRFMKTGESGSTSSTEKFAPPDAAGLLCDAHRMALLPPHLESFLYGETSVLLGSSTSTQSSLAVESDDNPSPAAFLPVGQGPTQESILAMRSLGLNEQEIVLQLSAMRNIEARQRQLQRQVPVNNNNNVAEETTVSRNELLDRENHSVVEILSQDEFKALEACWPGTTVFGLRFNVQSIVKSVGNGNELSRQFAVNFCTPICRSCDPSGRRCFVSIKNRARGWVRRSADKARAPASLEY